MASAFRYNGLPCNTRTISSFCRRSRRRSRQLTPFLNYTLEARTTHAQKFSRIIIHSSDKVFNALCASRPYEYARILPLDACVLAREQFFTLQYYVLHDQKTGRATPVVKIVNIRSRKDSSV